jgi:glycosyltransferase involved in cell wall biosynthesis
MVTISYAICAHNEHIELERLLNQLDKFIRPEDEIVIQLDSTATSEVKKVAEKYNAETPYGYHVIHFSLNKDFASFKNNLKKHCVKDYIFQIDADEYLSEHLLKLLPQVLKINNADCISVPRVNTVKGLTPEHIKQWGWNVDKNGRVNWPDYQTRICRNNTEIKWENKVHEKLTGWKTSALFPSETEDWALIHPKTIDRQEKQNNFYNTI